MRKTRKQLIALLLAAVLSFSMPLTSLAEEGQGGAPTGSSVTTDAGDTDETEQGKNPAGEGNSEPVDSPEGEDGKGEGENLNGGEGDANGQPDPDGPETENPKEDPNDTPPPRGGGE